jgi:hypothetical protein
MPDEGCMQLAARAVVHGLSSMIQLGQQVARAVGYAGFHGEQRDMPYILQPCVMGYAAHPKQSNDVPTSSTPTVEHQQAKDVAGWLQ